jgi:hypothetical protein
MRQKRLILLKVSPYTEVGHLYEHLYLTSLRQYFADNQLYSHLDYSIHAGTYENGVVYLEISLYTPAAITHKDEITKLPLNHSDISRHLRQISLENHHQTQPINQSELQEALKQLENRPWENIDELGVLNLQNMQPKTDLIKQTTTVYRRFRLHANIAIDGRKLFTHQPELLALFHQLSLFILHNYIDALCRQTGTYSSQDTFFDYGDAAALENTFYIDTAFDHFETCVDIAQNTLASILTHTVLTGFIEQLSINSYTNGDLSAPDDTRIYQETGLFIGSTGWQQLATTQNTKALLANMFFELKLGKNYHEIPLSQIIK